MTRTLATGMAAAVAAETGEVVHLIELNSSDGATYLSTAATNISWDSKTWTAIGGALGFDTVQETGDTAAQGVRVTFSGVDQTIISTILTYHMRGRVGKIYLAHLTGGAVVATPIEIFTGYWNDSWNIKETRGASGTVTVSTRIVSRIAALEYSNPVRANLNSHRELIRRGGFATSAYGDLFFEFLPDLVGKPLSWGSGVRTAISRDG